jgi:PAS domain S-box-containing protein
VNQRSSDTEVVLQPSAKEAALRERIRALEILNRVANALAGDVDLQSLVQTITDAGVELTGAQFGAFFYNVLDDSGESYTLYSLSGAPLEAFDKFPMPRNTAIFAPTFLGEAIVRSADITQDERYGLSAPHRGMPEGHLPVRSYLAAPVVSPTGEVLGGLFFGHATPRIFAEHCEADLQSLASQATIAIGLARLAESVQRELDERTAAERNFAFQAEQLGLAVSAAQIGTWDLNLQTDELYWSEHCRAMFGMSPDEPVSMADFYAGLHPADREATAEVFARACDPAVRSDYDVQYRTIGKNDGVERWIAARGKAFFDQEGCGVRAIGTTLDITAQKRNEQHLRLLVNELNHRVKNSLAVVQAVAAQTLGRNGAGSQAEAAFTARLIAIAKAHDVLTAENWDGADLQEVVRLTVSAAAAHKERFFVAGPSVRMSPKGALALSMAFHELATNALKYGALSTETGRVEIHWRLDASDDGERLRLTWREQGGPRVAADGHKGFGTRLIERGLAAELEGHVQLAYLPEGVVCTLDAPVRPAELGS